MTIKDSGNRRTFESGAVRDMAEVWKPVVGYEKFYEVSNFGRIRSLRKNTRIKDNVNGIMRQKFDTRGYLRVNITDEHGKQKAELVSRMVAKAFIPNPNNLPVVGHNDDNKLNNTVNNLYWTDTKENNFHNGKFEKFIEAREKKKTKIARVLSKPIIGTNINNGEKIYFCSMQEAERNGFSSAKISLCCSGKRRMHKGYKWEKVLKEVIAN